MVRSEKSKNNVDSKAHIERQIEDHSKRWVIIDIEADSVRNEQCNIQQQDHNISIPNLFKSIMRQDDTWGPGGNTKINSTLI